MDADAPPDWTPDADWTDKTQYYPTVLAPEPRAFARGGGGGGVAARLRHAEAAADEYLVVQLPSRLPLASNRGRGGEDALVTENKAGPTGGTHRRSETQTHSEIDFDFDGRSVAARSARRIRFRLFRRGGRFASWRRGASAIWRCSRTARRVW